jgi:hypothetical protein
MTGIGHRTGTPVLPLCEVHYLATGDDAPSGKGSWLGIQSVDKTAVHLINAPFRIDDF